MGGKLTVITVTRDDPGGLRATIDSLRALPPGFDWEHVVIDSSPEANGEVLRDLGPWPLRRLVEPPRGIYPAMNAGLGAATGEWIWFLNGGDRLRDPAALSRALSRLAARPEVVLLCAAADLTRRGRYGFTAYPRRTLARSLRSGRVLCHQAMIFRRDLFARLGPYSTEFEIIGDEEYLVRVWLSGLPTLCAPDRIVHHDTEGVSQRRYRQRHAERAELRRRLRHHLAPVDYWRLGWHLGLQAWRSRGFAWLRRWPGHGPLRALWLLWRRTTLRYR